MTPLIQLNRQLQYLFIAFLFACFALAQQAARGQLPNLPKDTILLNFSTPERECAPEKVRASGFARLQFKSNGGVLVPVEIQLKDVRGRGTMTKRLYEPTVEILPRHFIEVLSKGSEESPTGSFLFRFRMVGPPNPPGTGDPNPGKVFDFIVKYQVIYAFKPGQNPEFLGVVRHSHASISCPRS